MPRKAPESGQQRAMVIGGGLAGCEASWLMARAGLSVDLFEMRPEVSTPAHRTGLLAELVCSNSFKSTELTNAHGLLKEELTRLGSLVLSTAVGCSVPAGKALAVDRELFAQRITGAIEAQGRIRLVRGEVTELPPPGENIIILASGPLTSGGLQRSLVRLIGGQSLYFYDAISPVVDAGSIDMDCCFGQSRYGAGSDYLNCPLDEDLYHRFVAGLVSAETADLPDFERPVFFSGCMPIEQVASQGEMALAFGPLKPVGLTDPSTGKRPFAVLQLRLENAGGTMYNLVGCQTRLRQPDQRRVFGMIPALARAEFLRYGAVHRNTYINMPRVGRPVLGLSAREDLLVAGQITGVEGYLESAATGLLCGLNAARAARGLGPVVPPQETMLGALVDYIHHADPSRFQPMNANFGLLPPLKGKKTAKLHRRAAYAERALDALDRFIAKEVTPVLG